MLMEEMHEDNGRITKISFSQNRKVFSDTLSALPFFYVVIHVISIFLDKRFSSSLAPLSQQTDPTFFGLVGQANPIPNISFVREEAFITRKVRWCLLVHVLTRMFGKVSSLV